MLAGISPPLLWDTLSDYEKSFAVLELTGQRTPEYYQSRLKALGFTDHDHVLDAACGIGQWTISLAQLNNVAEGIDLMDSRISVANELSTANDKKCTFQTGSIETLPFPDQTFDGMFCYGAFMFTNMPRTLHEFARTLKPGGRLYLNANCAGWYAHLILDRGIKAGNYPLVRTALGMIGRTILGRNSQIIVRKDWLYKRLQEAGFSVVASGPEGTVNLQEGCQDLPSPAYPSSFYGMRSMIEVVALRK